MKKFSTDYLTLQLPAALFLMFNKDAKVNYTPRDNVKWMHDGDVLRGGKNVNLQPYRGG